MLRAILNKSWRQHQTKQLLYGHLPPITKMIKVRWTRHTGHFWRSRDELISDVCLWTPSHGRAKAGRLAWTCIRQLCADTGCSPEDLPKAMNAREGWRERAKYIRADGMKIWSWWFIFRVTFKRQLWWYHFFLLLRWFSWWHLCCQSDGCWPASLAMGRLL